MTLERRVLVPTFLMAVAGLAGLGLVGGSVPARPEEVQPGNGDGGTSIVLDGYPLDRSLDALVEFPGLDSVLLVSRIGLGEARWTTKDGRPPAYISENRPATQEEAATFSTIMTSATATVEKVLRGKEVAGDKISLSIVGGKVEGVAVIAGDGIAPDLNLLAQADTILVAGPVIDGVLNPLFIYVAEPGGMLRSAFAGSSDPSQVFGLDELETKLAAPATSNQLEKPAASNSN